MPSLSGQELHRGRPCLDGRATKLKVVANLLAGRRVDPLHEYFSGETGQGLGAARQAGWTALIANLAFRHYREDIPECWKSRPTNPTGVSP